MQKIFSKFLSVFTVLSMLAMPLAYMPSTAEALVIKPHENDKTFLEVTCDAVSVNGNVWTMSGTWTAYNFAGQSNQYDVAVASPTGTYIDESSKDSPDTFITLNGPSDYADDATPPKKDDMDGTWSNQVTFNSTPASISAALYHGQTGGNEISADSICTFVLPPKLTLLKTVVNDNGGTALDTAWTLSASGPTPISGVEGSADVTNKTVTPGAYTLSESGGPTGYTASLYSCVKNAGAPVVSNSISLANGDVATCTITNDDDAPVQTTGTLVVEKVVINDNGGTKVADDFSFQVNGGDAIAFEVDGSNSFEKTAGAYTVTEVAAPGYSTTYSAGCTAGVTVGNTTTCTITNDDQQATLIVTKIVENDDGGTLDVEDFKLMIDGDEVVSGAENLLDAGEYVVSEDPVAGYVGVIGGDCDTEGNVTLSPGESAECTITNTFVPTPIPGCMDQEANNYDSSATEDDDSCTYDEEEVENSCPLPDALGDTTPETVSPAPGEEEDLQEILDNTAYTLDVQADQEQFQVWNVDANSEVIIDATFINEFAGKNSVFGYYTDGDMSNFTPVFKTASITGYESTPLGTAGPFTVNTGEADQIGFAIKTFSGSTPAGDFATENSLNPASADQVVVYNPESNTYILGFEDITIGSSDKDFNDLVVEVKLSCELMCEEIPTTLTILSDSTTLENGEASVPVGGTLHSAWTALIPGATWIWGEHPVSDPVNDLTETFTKTFSITGTPTGGTLDIAADNSYEVWMNGNEVCADPTEANFSLAGQDTCLIDAADLLTGINTLTIEVKNWAQEGGTQESNPAGLLYKLTINSDMCVPPPPIDVCPNIPGNQTNESECEVPPPVDACPNEQTDPGVQTSGPCNSEDVCPDMEGIQTSPSECPPPLDDECDEGYEEVDNECVPICEEDEHLEESECVPDDNPEAQSSGSTSSGSRRTSSGSIPQPQGEVLGEQTELCSWDVNTYMRRGYKNDNAQVKILQNDLLNGYMNSGLVVDGIYGPKTEAAVSAFQVAKKDKILTPWNLTLPTGIFYKTTLVEAKNTICPTVILPIPTDLIPWSANPVQVPPKA